jgi:predicted adenine nucleotide alpha hydrolase (AANH) superfamily ATPase
VATNSDLGNVVKMYFVVCCCPSYTSHGADQGVAATSYRFDPNISPDSNYECHA